MVIRRPPTVTSPHNRGAHARTCVCPGIGFKHATRILDVIMLDYPVKVRPMSGMWVQSVPVTIIPSGRMKTEKRA
jgi:hypothetical protein